MGLDISLIKIVKESIDEFNWLNSDENPELLPVYNDYLSKRMLEDGSTEPGYWYAELSYQRKGVIKSFYEKYEADEFIFTASELQTLKQYIHPDCMNSFKVDFIEKFQEGINFIMIGY